MIRVVVFLSRYDARQTRRARKDATLPQTKPRARLDDARDELDERVAVQPDDRAEHRLQREGWW